MLIGAHLKCSEFQLKQSINENEFNARIFDEPLGFILNIMNDTRTNHFFYLYLVQQWVEF